jgi:hypothetical protein
MAIDWSGFGLPKTGQTPKKRKAARRRHELTVAAGDRDGQVMTRYGGKCVASGICPTCTGWAMDPHELIPVGAGGERASYNRVPICRTCHQEAQGRVGGIRLLFDWRGRHEGQAPTADVLGTLLVLFRESGLARVTRWTWK